MSHKSAKDAMTPVSKIFSLNINSKLDEYVLLLRYLFITVYSVTLLFLPSSLDFTERQWA